MREIFRKNSKYSRINTDEPNLTQRIYICGMRYIYLLCLCLLAACTRHKAIPENNLVYIQIGDSITQGEKNTAGNSPGDFAVRALATPTTFIKLGYPGESALQFWQSHRQQLLDSLAIIPVGRRVILGIGYGANDLNAMPKQQVLLSILRLARWARDTAQVREVLIIPALNRTDRWGFTREADGTKSYRFNASRHWLNANLHAQVKTLSGVKVASELYSPSMYADDYPANKTLCADGVHPLDAGAMELGAGTIAHGIASYGQVLLK